MISDRQIQSALEEHRVKIGAVHASFGRSVYSPDTQWFAATFMDADHTNATEEADTLEKAINLATVALLLKRDENKRRAGVALAYAREMGVTA